MEPTFRSPLSYGISNSGKRLPRNGLLLYLARPNSDEYLVGEDTEIGEDTYVWGYVLPDDADIRAATGWVSGTANVFYTSTGTPIVALATEIAQAVLPANVVFSLVDATTQTGKLAIYTAETTAVTLAKARAVLRDESINYLFYGRTGIWYDPQDLTTMYQDAGGTLPVYRPGSGQVDPPVGLLLDKSGGGHHASQTTTTARPKLSGRYNQLDATETLSTQSVTTVATNYTLRFEGTGTVTLSGTATGTYTAGTHTVTCTAGTLTLTVAGSVTKADLRVKRDGSSLPAYQRVDDANTYDTAGFPLYLKQDMVDADLIVGGIAVNINGTRMQGTPNVITISTDTVLGGVNNSFQALTSRVGAVTQWIQFDSVLSNSDITIVESYIKAATKMYISVGDLTGLAAVAKIGGSYSFVGDSALGGVRTFIQTTRLERVIQDGPIKSVMINGNTSGDVKVKVFRKSGSVYTMISESEIIPISLGVNTYTLSNQMSCQPGDYIGIHQAEGTIKVSSIGSVADAIVWDSGDITTTSTMPSVLSNYSLDITVFGASPFLAVTGDSIAEGHNEGVWDGIYTGPYGDLDAEVMHRMSVSIIDDGVKFDGYQNHADGGKSWAWVASTGGISAINTGAKAILVHCGVNDVSAGRSWEDVATNMDTLRSALSSGQKLFISEILPWSSGTDEQNATIREWNLNYSTWCKNNSAILVRCHDTMGSIRPSTNQLDDLKAAYNYYGVHLTKKGVIALASVWKKSLYDVY